MFHRTALLVFMVLAGTPLLSAGCELWCVPGNTMHDSTACHRPRPSAEAPEQELAGAPTCHDAVAEAPALTAGREDSSSQRSVSPAVIPATPPLPLDAAHTPGRWVVRDVLAPRAPFHAILRI